MAFTKNLLNKDLENFMLLNKVEFSTCATITTIIQLLSGVTVCRKYIINGSTGETSSAPFVLGALNAFCWLKYGLLIGDLQVIVVNTAGTILMSSYTICFCCYSSRRSGIKKQILIALLFAIKVELFILYGKFLEYSTEKYICGIIASALTIGFFASPLATIVNVVQTKSTSTLPFYMILANLFVTVQWWLYGLILDDYFIEIPNFLGMCLSAIQLSLFVIFPGRKIIDVSRLSACQPFKAVNRKYFGNELITDIS